MRTKVTSRPLVAGVAASLAPLLAATLTGCAGAPPADAPIAAPVSASAGPVIPDRLRPITGAQVCAAVPETLRASLLRAETFGDDIDWSNNVATATWAWGKCDWYRGAARSLEVTVQAYGTITRTATDHTRQVFDQSRASSAKQAVEPGDDGWTYTPPLAAKHGDAAFSLTGTETGERRSRYAHLVVRQGPWLISIRYRGEERDGALPAEAELRRGADRVAEVFTAEMTKAPGTVAPEDGGPCGAVSTADVDAAFFPSVTEVRGSRDAEDTTCTWKIRDGAGQTDDAAQTSDSCGRGVIQMGNVAPRCGELRIHISDPARPERAFDDQAARFAEDAPVKHLTGLGDRAFTVADQVHVLAGDDVIQLTYDGTNTGGGVRDAPGYQEPGLDAAALRKSLVRIAKGFVSARD
ncbi:hypothetical protein FAF44_20515 [Nonomuraea sp. MG754425]|uniref:hypothetical protein n=1 Tax=Nonomuraea sp. MG754425 TaxID=2570319 RepID=UPI001F37D736|nr:hypothetical protein [Nonomuraea sp. MG754425]MCF6470757.1 hypothetical protein [Nonomuraea sp. MG754425]